MNFTILIALAALLGSVSQVDAGPSDWTSWRGPHQNGQSNRTGLPEAVDPLDAAWTLAIAGRSTPVSLGNRVFAYGYEGEGSELQEVVLCLDARTGKRIWEYRINDFLSDVTYDRYTIGSPTVDPETGQVHVLSSAGILIALSPDGKVVWHHSMMESFGRLTFPNGRTGSPVIDGNLLITRGITTNWGKDGPASDRFYAFDKRTGDLVWTSTPGVQPRDSSFSTPVFGVLDGRRVFYAGTGCGNLVCVDARTGDPLKRFPLAAGGINSSGVLFEGHTYISIHGKENLDSSEIGRMVAVDFSKAGSGETNPRILGKDAELWRNELGIFTSSPVLEGERVFQVTHTGILHAVSARTGEILWSRKLGNSQLHASPLFADGKLYVPMLSGQFYVIRPGEKNAEILSEAQLEGTCLAAPSVVGKGILVQTTAKLYAFGQPGMPSDPEQVPALPPPSKPGQATRLSVVPSELILQPGQTQEITVHRVDALGQIVDTLAPEDLNWESWIPPEAKVQARLGGKFTTGSLFAANRENVPTAGAFRVTSGPLAGVVRGRILATSPFSEDFENFKTTVPHATETGITFAYPPLTWIGGRFKWEVRERDGNKALAKTLDRELFQRAMTFIGHPRMKNYTFSADVMTEGNRRLKSDVGLINQRYLINLQGNANRLEISSNPNRVRVYQDFKVKPGTWYRIKSRVDVAADGAGVIRAKAWDREEAEPTAWTLEAHHGHAHLEGSPGLFGFTPQSKMRVYVDNLQISSNEEGQ